MKRIPLVTRTPDRNVFKTTSRSRGAHASSFAHESVHSCLPLVKSFPTPLELPFHVPRISPADEDDENKPAIPTELTSRGTSKRALHGQRSPPVSPPAPRVWRTSVLDEAGCSTPNPAFLRPQSQKNKRSPESAGFTSNSRVKSR